ncbi:DUF11 domain-containing protein [Nocardioides sp. SR21]|uniref:DUF11 domain-containing protein n=1 Tax=Nocardioides sp. SR21 TaxID=2919501 RepID=UPI001FAB0895|nr:DUF11 domain-containing protein [Nocardioides sp. SR21]
MRRRSAHAVGLAAIGAAVLVAPLLVAAPAQALIPKSDLTIVKTVGSHGPTIAFNPALSGTGLNGHLEWKTDGLRVFTEKDLDSCVPLPPNVPPSTPPCPDFFELPEMRVAEYFNTSTPLSDVVVDAAQANPPTTWPEPQLYFRPSQPNAQVVLQARLQVDVFNDDGVADIELVRDLLGPGGIGGATWWGFVANTTDLNGNPVPYAPNIGGMNGTSAPLSTWVTTLNLFQQQLPWAQKPVVTAFGFGIPRGLVQPMDLTLRSIYFAGDYYDLRRSFQPSIGAAPGETVTYQVTISNGTGANTKAAAGVKVVDVLPPDMTYVPGSLVDDVARPPANPLDPWAQPTPGTPANCEFTGQMLTCAPGTLGLGATRTIQFDATLDDTISTTGLPQADGHWVDVRHDDASTSIPVGQTRTTTASCPEGYLATDGGLLLDQAASPDVVVESSRATSSSGVNGWTVRATNLGDARAVGSTQVTCLAGTVGASGGHTHAVDAQALPLQQKILPVMSETDARPVQRTCPAGYTPYAPQFETTSGIAVIRESYAIDNTWYWYVDHTDGTDASFGISCLAPRTLSGSGHTAQLVVSVPDDTISIGSENQTEGQMACPADSSAIVGGYGGYTARVRFLGAEPRGDRYLFRFYNEEDTAKNADIQVTCVGALTANEPTYKDVVNTAYATTTTKDRDAGDNTSSATVAVSGDPAPTQPSGVILNQLTATRTVANGRTTALALDMRCHRTKPCTFTVKAFSGGTLVASRTTSILAMATKNVVVPTTGAGKSLAFGDNLVVRIKTTAGTTQYAVGIVS